MIKTQLKRYSMNVEIDHEISQHIIQDKIRLLFAQLPVGILAHGFVYVILALGIESHSVNLHLHAWLLFMTMVSTLWLFVWFLYTFKKWQQTNKLWLAIFSLFAFISGVGWGMAASLLMPADSIIHQSFIIILIIGITAGAIPFFSPMVFIYSLFLFPAFLPLIVWLFLQGSIYTLLGYCAIIYTFVVWISCYYSNKFLSTSLALGYKNLNLDHLNQLLEIRVAERTSELQKSLAITKSTLESTADGILVVDMDGGLEYYNQQFLNLWQVNFPQNSPQNLDHFIKQISHRLQDSYTFNATIAQLTNFPNEENFEEISLVDGHVFEWHSKPHKIGKVIAGRVWSFHDITHRKEMEYQLSFQANHDVLTGLPSRKLLYDRIIHGIRYARRHHLKLILLFLDIDNFKLINDNLGHDAGDRLLEQIAKRLKACTRESDTVSRFGGDEFVILYYAKDYDDVIMLCQRVLEAVTSPINMANHKIVVTASIGVSLYPKDGDDAATLLKNADMAMYQAKNLGRNNFKLYDDSIRIKAQKSLELQIELRNALANNEFFLVYQPTINLKTGEIIGAEALVRWQHPEKGVILPQQFIPSAEESGLIIPIGEWIFSQACEQNKIWQDRQLKPIPVAINVSGVQIMQENFILFIDSCLQKYQLPPCYIEIELTESVIMDNKQSNLKALQAINNKGIRLTVDDFGTGYSSLSYLRDFPVSKLKIDQSFIAHCPMSSNNASIVEAIVALGHGLKMRVLAEGVETEEQLQFLKNLHCDEGQGFIFSQPLKADEFADLLINAPSQATG